MRVFGVARVLASVVVFVSLLTQAWAYDVRDAQYVTPSSNLDVLLYVVCLQENNDQQPRSASINEALNAAIVACQSAAATLPNDPNEPNALEIQQSILECGFKQGDASPDVGCGEAGGGNASSYVADTIVHEPTLIEAGKWLESIAFDGRFIWTADSGQRTVTEIEFDTHEVAKQYDVGRLPVEVVVDDDSNVYSLIATDKKILKHDTKRRTTTLTTFAECVDAMDAEDATLWVLASTSCGSSNSSVVSVNARSGVQNSSGDLGEWATDILPMHNGIWVSHANREEITIVDKNTLNSRVIAIPDSDLWSLSTDYQSVIAAGRRGGGSNQGLVVKINADTFAEEGRVVFPEMVVQAASDGVFIYAVTETGRIYIVSLLNMDIMRTVDLQLPNVQGGQYRPTDMLLIEDLLVIAAGQFMDFSGAPIVDRLGNPDENGGILLVTNIAPDATVATTPKAGNASQATPQTASTRPSSTTTTTTTTGRPGRPTVTTTTTTTSGRPTRPSTNNSGGTTATPTTTTTTTTAGRPSRPSTTTTTTTTGRPSRPSTATAGKPSTPAGRPSRPSTGTTASGKKFPIVAGSRGGNVRSAPRANGKKIGSTAAGQPITLLENVGKNYKKYPWFKIRMSNGKVGYQWGGGICANKGKPVSGVKGTCKASSSNGKRPSKPSTSGGKKDGVDVIVSVLDLIGKVLDSNNNSNANSSVFTQTLNVLPNGSPAIATRKLEHGKTLALYTVRGKKGQTLDVSIWSPSQNAVFEIYIDQASDGGATLSGAAQGANTQSFLGKLPKNANYQILVGSVNGPVEFELFVALEKAAGGGTGNNSGGTLQQNRTVVGTYSSKTAQSGNIELNEGTNSLTWTEFCGPVIPLTADWANKRLVISGGNGTFDLNVSKAGKVRGFNSNGHKFTKEQGIIMPGCVGTSTSPGTNFVDWINNPQDPRSVRLYDMVPNAWWGTCEADNNNQNSPKFNNEKAYWDCADAGQLAGGGVLTPVSPNASTPAAADPRQNNDYTSVPQSDASACNTAFPNSPADDKGFYDCLDAALISAGGTPTPGVAADPRQNNDYSAVPQAASDVCYNAYPNSPADDKGYYDCMDAALINAGGTPTAGSTPDPRQNNDYTSVPQSESGACNATFPNSPADDKGFYDCMDAALISAGGTPTPGIAPDPRQNNDYTAVSQAASDVCYNAYPNSPADDKGYYDCMDAALINAGGTPTPGATGDPRQNKNYGQVGQAAVTTCDTNYPNSPADDKGYYDCMDAALIKAGSTPAPGAAGDPRQNNDYSQVGQAEATTCHADYPNSPADDKGYFDCMDAALINAGGTPTAGTTPDPRQNNDYSHVSPAAMDACGVSYPNSPADDKGYYDCLDAQPIASGNSPSTGNNAGPDPRQNNDYTAVSTSDANQCGIDWPNSPADDKGYYDCMDAGLIGAGGTPTAGGPDPRQNNDYTSVDPAYAEQCGTSYPDSPADDKGYYDCLDAGLGGAGNSSSGGGNSTPAAGPDPRQNNDYTSVDPAYAEQCGTSYPDSPADDKGYYDCLDAGLGAASSSSSSGGGNSNSGPSAEDLAWNRIDNEFSDMDQNSIDGCSGYGFGSDAFFDCLYSVRDSMNQQQQQQPANDNSQSPSAEDLAWDRINNEFSDMDQNSIDGCSGYGFGSSDFFDCLYNVRESMNQQQQQQQQEPANDNSQSSDGGDPFGQIQNYCSSTHGGNYDACYADLEYCYYEHNSVDSDAFGACGANWF